MFFSVKQKTVKNNVRSRVLDFFCAGSIMCTDSSSFDFCKFVSLVIEAQH